MQEDAPSCRHSHHEAKNSVLCPVSCFPASGMRLSATCSAAVSPIFFPSLALPLLYPFPFFPPIFVFVLLPSACVLPSSRLFSFKGDPPFRLRQEKNEERKATFAFSFFFPERRNEMRSFFLFHDERKREKNILRSFFFFLKKESVLSPASVWGWEGRFIAAFFLFFFFLLSVRKRQTIHAYGCWRSLLFSFRLQEKKRRER